MLFSSSIDSTPSFSYSFLRFFFFKQKPAYEFSACFVGSEMCVGTGGGAIWRGSAKRRWNADKFMSGANSGSYTHLKLAKNHSV